MPVFEKLEPPAGGLSGLRKKLDESRNRRRTRAAWWVMVPAACTAVVLAWTRPLQPDPRLVWRDVQNPALVRLGLQPSHAGESVTVRGNAAVMVADGVYWVGAAGTPVEDDAR